MSMRWRRVGHDGATSLSISSMLSFGEGNGSPPRKALEPGETWWTGEPGGLAHGVAEVGHDGSDLPAAAGS